MFSIEFNNYNSYKDLGLVVENKPIIPCPERNINVIEIQGRNGTLTEDFGTYKDINISFNFGFIEKNNFEHKVRFIKHWLNNIQNRKLILSNDTEVFYKVKHVKLDSIDRSMRTLGRFAVSFVCEPFCYLKEGLEIVNIYNKDKKVDGINVYNSGTLESEPYIKIYGNGDFNLNINASVFLFKNIDSYIEVDSEIMNCYKDHVNLNEKMYGDFPRLEAGKNNFNWHKGIEKIEIIPRWRCI